MQLTSGMALTWRSCYKMYALCSWQEGGDSAFQMVVIDSDERCDTDHFSWRLVLVEHQVWQLESEEQTHHDTCKSIKAAIQVDQSAECHQASQPASFRWGISIARRVGGWKTGLTVHCFLGLDEWGLMSLRSSLELIQTACYQIESESWEPEAAQFPMESTHPTHSCSAEEFQGFANFHSFLGYCLRFSSSQKNIWRFRLPTE